MKYQVFMPMLLLQFLNVFWFSLMTKILVRFVHCWACAHSRGLTYHRAIKTAQAEDDRSDDEGEAEGADESPKEKED